MVNIEYVTAAAGDISHPHPHPPVDKRQKPYFVSLIDLHSEPQSDYMLATI